MAISPEERLGLNTFYRTDILDSQEPEVLGAFPDDLVAEFKALPPMLYSACSYYRTYVAYGMAELQQVPDLPPVVPHLRRAFCELVGVELEKCETRFGWWTGNPDSEFHLDSPQGLALENKSASIGGPTTEVAVGLCDRIRKEHFEIIVRPRPNARVYSLDEGVAYRMGPGTAHREPLCVEPANRVFFRVLSS